MKERVPGALAGERLDRVVAMLSGLPRGEVAELVAAGDVSVDGREVRTRSRRVAEGEVVEFTVPERPDEALEAGEAAVPFRVVHADADVVVVDKPPGLVVHPGAGNADGTLVQALLASHPSMASVGDPGRPGVVHRLDKETSGLLVVALTDRAYESLVDQLSSRAVERLYTALVWGEVEGGSGVVDAPVGRSEHDPTRMAVSARGREARTRYEVAARFAEPVDLTLLMCRLETGRTHQIRVHLAAIDHPIVGDGRYGGSRRSFEVPRPFLHAHRLAFDHPATGERVAFESPLPPDLVEVVDRLR